MRFTLQILTIAAILMACSTKEENVIRINPDQVISENFIGLGVQWDPYPHADTDNAEWGKLMTDEKWDRIFQRLDYMKPRLVRVVDQANWRYLKGFDNDGNAILDFSTDEEKALEKLLGYCQQNNITVMLGEWGCPYQVHDVEAGFSGILKGANDHRWIEMIVKHLQYLIIEKELSCIKYFNLVNEPNGNWASTDGNWKEWSEGIKLLSKAIKEAGLDQYVSVSGPDAVAHYDHGTQKPGGMGWIEKTTKELKHEIGALDLHAYFDLSIIREAKFDSIYKPLVELAKSIEKPIVFGEVGYEKATVENQNRITQMPYTSADSYVAIYDYQHGIDVADAGIQIVRAGFQGAAAWALDDAMHTNNDSGDKNNLKRWGMWNSLGTELCNDPDDENIRPWFFTWALLCRYIEPDSRIVNVEGAHVDGLRMIAATKNGDYTLAIVNQSDEAMNLNLQEIKELKGKLFQLFHYEEGNYLVDENGFPQPVNKRLGFTSELMKIEVPAHGFKLITSYNY